MMLAQHKILKYAICSNALYVFLFFLFRPQGISFSKLAISFFLAFSVALIIYLSLKQWAQLNQLGKWPRNIFIILILWGVVNIVRGLSLDLQDWVTNFGNVYMGLAWLVPLALVIGIKVSVWKTVFKSIWFMFQLMLIATLFSSRYYESNSKLPTEWTWLLRPINLIYLVGINRFRTSLRILVYVTIAVYIYIAIASKQRIEFIYLSLIILFVFIDNFRTIKVRKTLIKYFFAAFIILLVLIFTYGYENLSNFVLSYIEFQDTRVFLYNELLTELSPAEKVYGRGSLGTYYSHFMEKTKNYTINYLEQQWWGDASDRITIEVGYLQMILKGGFLLFFLNLYLMLRSAYLGIFKSSNKFVRRLGIYILAISILSIISFRPAFTPTFILLWLAIGTVLNKNNRALSDAEINELIGFKHG